MESESEPSPPPPPSFSDADDPPPSHSPELPEVIALSPLLPAFDAALSARFRLLKPSPLPLSSPISSAASAALVRAPTRVDAALLDLVPSLRLVVTTSAGLDHFDLPECARRGVAVASAGHVFSPDVADYAVALLLDVLRRISASGRYLRRGEWPLRGDYPLGSKLGGKRVGIVGLGSIGSLIAKRLEVFGCIISYNSRKAKPSVSYKFFPTVYDLATECDVLILSCAFTNETRHIVNKDVMHALGKDGVIINIARGGLIDEEELVKCLMQGEIKGAGLDVFENEPSVPNKLFTMDNVVLSPHLAAFTTESSSDLLELIIANFEAFFSNKPLITPVSM
ncbi:glyoxylate/hydroxypyruvate reductase HPR3-like [Ananas comosus]|uniref:Glyoxylate/hydroxypyruvate reductase HPR3-like n=1 Tax=Ananas comosus TaxID=4615 RepID=A0A6P5ENL2_ANACO|nr:glyoxylate/hydroxypyruvate reductase HPR3-like [Ananas comosus]